MLLSLPFRMLWLQVWPLWMQANMSHGSTSPVVSLFETVNFAYVQNAWLQRAHPLTIEYSHFSTNSFQENVQSISPVLLDYYNPSSQKELKVIFQRCSFVQNSFYGVPAQPALIVGNGEQNRLIIHGCWFSDNDMVSNNYAIVSEKGLLILSTNNPASKKVILLCLLERFTVIAS